MPSDALPESVVTFFHDVEPAVAWLEAGDGRRAALRGNCRIGRATLNEIIIDGPKASRRHAAIHLQEGPEFWLMDLGSRNGTFRNERRVLRPTRLRDGDRIAVAGVCFLFRQPGTAATPSTDIAGPATLTDFREQPVWLLIADMESFARLSQELPVDRLAGSVGRWIQDCRGLVEKDGGRISKFLGDGFLACWEGSAERAPAVAHALGAFHALRSTGPVQFRVAVHHGNVTFGGTVQLGDESMIGPELNFVFRLEKLASSLRVPFCASSPAQALLAPHVRSEPIAGEHELKGFSGAHRCHALLWP